MNFHWGEEGSLESQNSWLPRGLWTLIPNSWVVGGLHLEEGIGGCARELETFGSSWGIEGSLIVAPPGAW